MDHRMVRTTGQAEGEKRVVKIAVHQVPHSGNRNRDFEEYERMFRDTTVEIAQGFSSEIHDVWAWTKQRLSLVTAPDAVITRHHGDGKQRSYIESGADAIWEKTSQSLLGIVRQYVPVVVSKVEDVRCPNQDCDNIIKKFSNREPAVQKAWGRFWEVNKTTIGIERQKYVNDIVDLVRVARRRFKLVFSPTCLDKSGNPLPNFQKDIFLPELITKLNAAWLASTKKYIEAVIQYLPEMVSFGIRCCKCKTRIEP